MATADPITPAELEIIAERQKLRNVLALLGVLISAVAMVAFIVIAAVLLNAAEKTQRLSDRSDCKTEYSSVLAGPVKVRDNLNASLGAQLGRALLNSSRGTPSSAEVVARYDATQSALEDAIDEVNDLPTLQRAAERGFTLDGHHYPPCPTA